jgi:nucleotide-binding universal stress UspA family protein
MESPLLVPTASLSLPLPLGGTIDRLWSGIIAICCRSASYSEAQACAPAVVASDAQACDLSASEMPPATVASGGAGAAMFKDILLTVDLEHMGSWVKALPVALHSAKASGARLHVMTVVPEVAVPALMRTGPYDFEASLVPAAEAALDQFVRKHLPADIEAHQIVAYGVVYREILRVATEIPADLIVMAAHRPQPGDFLIGSNAERVSRRTGCSVMLVR